VAATEDDTSNDIPRRLLSDGTWLHPTLAHGKSIDFNNGGLSSQQEDMQAAIESLEAAAEAAAATPGGAGRRRLLAATADAIFNHLSHTEAAVSGHTSRRLLSDQTWLHPTLAHGKSISFNDGGLSSQEEDMQAAVESHEAAAETAAASPGGVMGRKLLVLRGTASVSP
jgi:hypothetical protein